MYVCLDVKELTSSFDLNEAVILTMLNQLEQSGPYFRVDSILPRSIGLRFHKESLEELAQNDKFFQHVLNVEPTSCQGVHRVSLIDLANEIGVKPYQVPRILYAIQNNGLN